MTYILSYKNSSLPVIRKDLNYNQYVEYGEGRLHILTIFWSTCFF